MSGFNKYRGEVAFPFLEDGLTKAVFRYTFKNLEALSTRYGENYLGVMINAQKAHNATVLKDFILMGLKGEGGSALPAFDIDDPPFPLGATYQPMFDAIMFSITGMTGPELAEREVVEKAKVKDEVERLFPLDPLADQATSSNDSAGQDMNSV